MKYFQVLKQTLVGDIVEGEVDIDGDYTELPETAQTNEERELSYTVVEYDDSGITNTVVGLTLDEIKEQYSADKGWQNNNW